MASGDLTERLAEAIRCVLGHHDDHDDHGRVIAHLPYCTEHGDDWPCRWGPLVEEIEADIATLTPADKEHP